VAPLVKGSALLKVKVGNRASPPTLRSAGVVGAADRVGVRESSVVADSLGGVSRSMAVIW